MTEFKGWYKEFANRVIASRAAKLETDLMEKLSWNQLHEFSGALSSMERGSTHIGIDFPVNRYSSGSIHGPNITRTIKLDSEGLEYFKDKYMPVYEDMRIGFELEEIKSPREAYCHRIG